jgi:hypothetical protein
MIKENIIKFTVFRGFLLQHTKKLTNCIFKNFEVQNHTTATSKYNCNFAKIKYSVLIFSSHVADSEETFLKFSVLNMFLCS